MEGLEPPRISPLVPKTSASTNSATCPPHLGLYKRIGQCNVNTLQSGRGYCNGHILFCQSPKSYFLCFTITIGKNSQDKQDTTQYSKVQTTLYSVLFRILSMKSAVSFGNKLYNKVLAKVPQVFMKAANQCHRAAAQFFQQIKLTHNPLNKLPHKTVHPIPRQPFPPYLQPRPLYPNKRATRIPTYPYPNSLKQQNRLWR